MTARIHQYSLSIKVAVAERCSRALIKWITRPSCNVGGKKQEITHRKVCKFTHRIEFCFPITPTAAIDPSGLEVKTNWKKKQKKKHLSKKCSGSTQTPPKSDALLFRRLISPAAPPPLPPSLQVFN